MSQVGLAVMQRQLIGREDEFFFRDGNPALWLLGVKRVDDQRAVDFDRLLLVSAVEVEPRTEAANAGLTG